MADGDVVLQKALGVSVRFTEQSTGYGPDDYDETLTGELLIGDVVIFTTDMTAYRWAMDDRQEQAVEELLRLFGADRG